jgi:hypothetical protein
MQHAKLFGALFAYVNNIQITWKTIHLRPRAGEANQLFSVYIVLWRSTALAIIYNVVGRQRNLGLVTMLYRITDTLLIVAILYNMVTSPRFLCRPTTLYIIARAVERQSAIYTENSWFASPVLGRNIFLFYHENNTKIEVVNIFLLNMRTLTPVLGRHISTFRGYRILLTIGNPYINRFTNHFSTPTENYFKRK